jgi:hypothetical protein
MRDRRKRKTRTTGRLSGLVAGISSDGVTAPRAGPDPQGSNAATSQIPSDQADQSHLCIGALEFLSQRRSFFLKGSHES